MFNKLRLVNKRILIYLFFVSIFVIGFLAGATSYKEGYFSFHKNNILSFSKNITNIIPNLINKFYKSEIEEIYIETNNVNYLKINSLRSMAIKTGEISEEIKNFKINTKIYLNNSVYFANLSLAGTNLDHLLSKNKWSFRITNTRIDNDLNDMSNKLPEKFTLLVPYGRGNNLISEWINLRLNKYLGNLSINYEFKKIYLNKKYLGIYAFEEHFDTILNRKPHGSFIFKIVDENSIKIYSKENNLENLYTHNAYFKDNWNKFITKQIEVKKLFDLDKISMHYALSDLVNGHHTHHLTNNFFLYNNETKLLEPIAKEWETPYLKSNRYDVFINKHLNFGSDKTVDFHSLFFRDEDFVRKYYENLKKISDENFIESFLVEIKTELENYKKVLKADYPHKSVNEIYLYDKINFINKSINF